jgi:hypothetical protein
VSHERLSRKPDEFYDLIQRVTETGRIDVFSREQRAGFDQYGNETEKWATKQTGLGQLVSFPDKPPSRPEIIFARNIPILHAGGREGTTVIYFVKRGLGGLADRW